MSEMRYKATQRYIPAWTDPRGMYGVSPRRLRLPRVSREKFWEWYGLLVGTFIVTAPIGVVSYWVFKLFGWME